MDKDLKSAAFTDAALGKVQMATFSVGDKVQAEDVIGPIADYLGADRDRHLVRLRFGDDVRYLRRTDIYKFVDTAAKGFGENSRNLIHPHDGDHICFHLIQHAVAADAQPPVTATDKGIRRLWAAD